MPMLSVIKQVIKQYTEKCGIEAECPVTGTNEHGTEQNKTVSSPQYVVLLN